MSEPQTLGQVAYEAYWPAFGMAPQVPWAQIIPDNKRGWEAAAQAVAARAVADTLEVQRILAGAVRRVEEKP